MTTLIGSDDTWAIWTLLLGAAAFGAWAERTRWGRRLSGAVVTIAATFFLSNLRVIPAAAPAYDTVWSFFVPLAIPLLLLNADIRRVFREAGPTLFAFAAGAVGTVIGTLVAFHLVPLGEEGHKLAGIFCATYIGGSVNYVAAAQALSLRAGDLLSAGVAADNLVMTLYFLVLFALPSIPALRRRYRTRHFIDSDDAPNPTTGGGAAGAGNDVDLAASASTSSGLRRGDTSWAGLVPLRLLDLLCALALAAALCAAGYGIAAAAGWGNAAILVITALTVLVATLFPRRLARLAGASELGTLLMMVFFAVIGASANIFVVVRTGSILFVFAAVILLIHLVFILAAGWLMRLDLSEIVIASNANMGGPTTAAAMASARRWKTLVTPAILCGTLGYAVATFIGAALGTWLGP